MLILCLLVIRCFCFEQNCRTGDVSSGCHIRRQVISICLLLVKFVLVSWTIIFMYHSLFSPCFVTNKESVRRNFNTMKILYFSSKNFPNLAFPGNSCLIQSLLWGEQKNHFPAQPVRKLLPGPLPHATYSDGFPSLYVFLCMHVCIHLFIYLLQVWTHEFVFL